MKITINQHDEEVSIYTKHDDLTANQMAEIMHRMCHALGYHSQNIAEAFCEIGEEMIETDEH
jgi:deoxyhypusine synthase